MRAVGAVAIKHGHEVMVSNTRTPDTLFPLTGSLGCKAGSPQEAAEFGEIVLVAIPLKAYQTIPVAPLKGKMVLDANNYYPERDGHIGELDRDEITTSELLARHLPKSKVVKPFNAIQAAHIETYGPRPARLTGERIRSPEMMLPQRRWSPISSTSSGSMSWMPASSRKEGASRRIRPRIAYQWTPGSCRKRSPPFEGA